MARPRKGEVTPDTIPSGKPKRRYLSQSDVPLHTVEDALRVPRAIADNYGKQPTSPADVATALGTERTTSGFRTLAGSALAYGLTDGGPNVELIGLTPLSRRIIAPTIEGDDVVATREALLKPRVVREFLEKYDGSRLPLENIGRNVLEGMGVPVRRRAGHSS